MNNLTTHIKENIQLSNNFKYEYREEEFQNDIGRKFIQTISFLGFISFFIMKYSYIFGSNINQYISVNLDIPILTLLLMTFFVSVSSKNTNSKDRTLMFLLSVSLALIIDSFNLLLELKLFLLSVI